MKREMKQDFHDTGNKGFTLLEVLISVTVLAIGLLGIAGMITASIRADAFSQRMTIATNLIQDKIEEMKNMEFDDLFKASGADPNLSSGAAPNPMTDIDVPNGGTQTVVTPVQNGNEWEYRFDATIGGVTHQRVWMVERNPDIDGNGVVYPADGDEGKTLRIGGIVTWKDVGGKAHTVRLFTVITGGS